MKFNSFDYDNNETAQWLRVGECNHCGECCEVMTYLNGNNDDPHYSRDGGETTDLDGLWSEWVAYGRNRYWKIDIHTDEPCECFLKNKEAGYSCVDGSEVKGLICTGWPFHPNQVECFNNCSFSFVKLHSWVLDECKDKDSKKVKEVNND